METKPKAISAKGMRIAREYGTIWFSGEQLVDLFTRIGKRRKKIKAEWR